MNTHFSSYSTLEDVIRKKRQQFRQLLDSKTINDNEYNIAIPTLESTLELQKDSKLLNTITESDDKKNPVIEIAPKLLKLIKLAATKNLKIEEFQKSLDEFDSDDEENLICPICPDGNTILHLLAAKDFLQCFRSILEKTKSPKKFMTCENFNGITPLHIAVATNSTKILKYLISNEVDVDGYQESKVPAPLLIAAKKGNLKCIKILLELSVSLNVTDDADANPLLVALESKHFEIADYILNYAQKQKKISKDIGLPDEFCKWLFEDSDVANFHVRMNHEKQGDLSINHFSSWHGSALSLSILHRRFLMAEKLIKLGADCNTHSIETAPPMIMACSANRMELIKSLIENNANINCVWIREVPKNWDTPLCVAIAKRNDYLVKTLLELKADPDKYLPAYGDTHTIFAARLVTGMIHDNRQKNTKQFHERLEERQNVLKILITHGADCDILNEENENVWDKLSACHDIKKKLFEFYNKFCKRKNSNIREALGKIFDDVIQKSDDVTNSTKKKAMTEESIIAMFTGEKQANKKKRKTKKKKKKKKSNTPNELIEEPLMKKKVTPDAEKTEEMLSNESENSLMIKKEIKPISKTKKVIEKKHVEISEKTKNVIENQEKLIENLIEKCKKLNEKLNEQNKKSNEQNETFVKKNQNLTNKLGAIRSRVKDLENNNSNLVNEKRNLNKKIKELEKKSEKEKKVSERNFIKLKDLEKEKISFSKRKIKMESKIHDIETECQRRVRVKSSDIKYLKKEKKTLRDELVKMKQKLKNEEENSTIKSRLDKHLQETLENCRSQEKMVEIQKDKLNEQSLQVNKLTEEKHIILHKYEAMKQEYTQKYNFLQQEYTQKYDALQQEHIQSSKQHEKKMSEYDDFRHYKNENRIIIEQLELSRIEIQKLQEKYENEIGILKERQFEKHFANMDKIRELQDCIKTCYEFDKLNRLDSELQIEICGRINKSIEQNQIKGK